MRTLFDLGLKSLRKMRFRLRIMRQGKFRKFDTYLPFLQGKSGLEIGGPSEIFRKKNLLPVYAEVSRLDNCDFSKSTVWAEHNESFLFEAGKSPGNTFFYDGSALVEIPDSTYDVLLSSHNLEHFANPVKALKEWQRVLKPGGALVLVLPYYQATFDHRRSPTSVDHMFQDFDRNIQEDDLTHLQEILEKHDLVMDILAGTKEEFHKRSLENYSNRCLHHHVFDGQNSRELLARAGFDVLSLDLALPHHICILAASPLS